VQKFNSERSSYESMYLGSRPPSDGNWETWMNSTGASPYPIRYSLRPLVELLHPVYFSKSDASTMLEKRARSRNATHSAFLILLSRVLKHFSPKSFCLIDCNVHRIMKVMRQIQRKPWVGRKRWGGRLQAQRLLYDCIVAPRRQTSPLVFRYPQAVLGLTLL